MTHKREIQGVVVKKSGEKTVSVLVTRSVMHPKYHKTVKRFKKTGNTIELIPENPDFQVITVKPGDSFEIEGLAVGLIRNTFFM